MESFSQSSRGKEEVSCCGWKGLLGASVGLFRSSALKEEYCEVVHKTTGKRSAALQRRVGWLTAELVTFLFLQFQESC